MTHTTHLFTRDRSTAWNTAVKHPTSGPMQGTGAISATTCAKESVHCTPSDASACVSFSGVGGCEADDARDRDAWAGSDSELAPWTLMAGTSPPDCDGAVVWEFSDEGRGERSPLEEVDLRPGNHWSRIQAESVKVAYQTSYLFSCQCDALSQTRHRKTVLVVATYLCIGTYI
jgi:hypothetical protein